ncbi:MAG: hypothetical protein LC667_01625, partial [Thioalkalivibrio sp.]|nr:hypothetical protein [Thioalkalivibrio sp.]
RPGEPDTAEFRFALPQSGESVTVATRLVYRWAFKPLADMKGWTADDRLMRESILEVTLPSPSVAAR